VDHAESAKSRPKNADWQVIIHLNVTPTNHPSRKSKDMPSEVQAGTTQEGP